MIPLQLFIAALVGWLQGDQHKVIDYLREENRVLKAQVLHASIVAGVGVKTNADEFWRRSG